MHRPIVIFFLIIFYSFSYGQQTLIIEGEVTDITAQKPIANAAVILKSKDTTVIIHADENGKYRFTPPLLKPNKIYLLIAAGQPLCGYSGNCEYYVSTFGLDNNSRTFLRNIELKENSRNVLEPEPSSPVYFSFKDNSLSHLAKDSSLRAWLYYLRNNPTAVVNIDGYADKKEGSKKFLLMLSAARAQECLTYLRDSGIQLARLCIPGNNPLIPYSMSAKAIRNIKGRESKMAARLLNCRVIITVNNLYFTPPSTKVISGRVTDINTGLPVAGANIDFSGSDGTQLLIIANNNGEYKETIKSFNPLSSYIGIAGALGYNTSDPEEILKINPNSIDMPVYTYNFHIARNGYEKPFVFPPIMFDSGSVSLSDTALDSLNCVKKIMNERPGIVLEFMGDADWHESGYLELAIDRARSCVRYLISQGIDSARFITSSRLSEPEIEIENKTSTQIVKQKDKQRLFNPKRCTASFWIMRWDYKK